MDATILRNFLKRKLNWRELGAINVTEEGSKITVHIAYGDKTAAVRVRSVADEKYVATKLIKMLEAANVGTNEPGSANSVG